MQDSTRYNIIYRSPDHRCLFGVVIKAKTKQEALNIWAEANKHTDDEPVYIHPLMVDVAWDGSPVFNVGVHTPRVTRFEVLGAAS